MRPSVVISTCLREESSGSKADKWVALSTLVAALTYLFDVGSNVATAYHYYQYRNRFFQQYGHHFFHWSEGKESEGSYYASAVLIINDYSPFIAVVTLMAVAHVTNALIFCLTLDRKDQPLSAAYFLPLIHLKRLIQVIWSTCNIQGFKDLMSPDQANLYNILAAALETGPQLILQCIVLHVVGSLCSDCKLPKVLVVSIIGSLISSAYNGGAAIASIQPTHSPLLARFQIGILGGMYTLCALIVRSLSFSLLFMSTPVPYFATYACLALIIPFILFCFLSKPIENGEASQRSYYHWKTLLHSLGYGHVSVSLGPLYPLTRHAYKRKQQGKAKFHVILVFATLAHLLLDVAGLIIIYKTKIYLQVYYFSVPPCVFGIGLDRFLPCGSFVALLSIGITLCIISIIYYIIIDKDINDSNNYNVH